MSRVEGQDCWVLHRRPWRESSLLIELFTRDHGRLGVVARGARSARSAWRGLAEPFTPLVAGWTRRGEMGTLVALEASGERRRLSGRVLWCGLYANELVLKLLARDDGLVDVFDGYTRLLSGLAQGFSPSTLLRRFEIELLQAQGVAPELRVEAGTGVPIEPDRLYHLRPETGLTRANARSSQVFSGRAALVAAGQLEPDRDSAREARDLTRLLIDHQLDGRPLKTRELFRFEGMNRQ
jgi:DNA repair protein RecO (recombination protein O)